MSIYTAFLRSLIFRLEAERAHNLTLDLLASAGALSPLRAALRSVFAVEDPNLRVRAFGLNFPNPLGLAAGYDKDGRAIHGLACLGFGHLEIGTVTPLPQEGNPRPRVFRLPQDRGLINRMGFPNAGAEALLKRLRRGRPKDVVIGINLGKGLATSLERAAEDYLSLLRTFYDQADYLAVNVSSPNTIGLRRLQARHNLESLLKELSKGRNQLVASSGLRRPILVKLAPDLSQDELEDAVGAVLQAGMDGVIATNTTVQWSGLRSQPQVGSGGLSGAPLRARATEVVREVHRLAGARLPIIGVGGVFGPQDAREKLDAGASLVQVYTGLIYRGPGLVRSILRGL